ncbi:hypothetical protein ACH5RR_015692 [Cinchona calisaya]|uniref:FAR1 domain-containing protein n=1 Tax=Cinchona calisaya TaxID=153742 RepID=A0ABD2ZZ96_9GENT
MFDLNETLVDDSRQGHYDGEGYEQGMVDDQHIPNIHIGSNYVIDDLEEEHVISMEFESMEDAKCFYTLSSRATGFGIRKCHQKMNRDGMITWLCSREGERLNRHIDRENKLREPEALMHVN